VRENSQAHIQLLGPLVRDGDVTLVAKFRDGIRDCVIQAAIESSKLVYINGRLDFKREIGYRLAKITVVVNNLLHCEPVLQ